MDSGLKECIFAAIGAVVTLGSAYIAARWNVSRLANKRVADDVHPGDNPSKDVKTSGEKNDSV